MLEMFITASMSFWGIIVGHCCVSCGKALIQLGKKLLDPARKETKKNKKLIKLQTQINTINKSKDKTINANDITG